MREKEREREASGERAALLQPSEQMLRFPRLAIPGFSFPSIWQECLKESKKRSRLNANGPVSSHSALNSLLQ